MQKRFIFLFIATILLTLFVLYSCNESNVVENKKIEKQERPVLKKETDTENNSVTDVTATGKLLGYKVVKENGKEVKVPVYEGDPNRDIQPDKLQCNYYIQDNYEFDHYESKYGKWLGIWDGHHKKSYNDLYTKWCFTKYFVSTISERNNAIDAGFDPDNLMANIKRNNNGSFSITPGVYKNYFLDEPFEYSGYDYSGSQIVFIANELSPSKLFMSSYKDDSFNDNPNIFIVKPCEEYEYVLTHTDNTFMMCDQYYDGTIWYGNDQRDYWGWFRNYYGGDRVKSHWISLDIDGGQGDFYRLFEEAKNLNLSTIWLFVGNSNNFNNYIIDYRQAAFENGYLRKYMKKYRYWYKCPEYFGDPCYCSKNDGGWVLDHISYMGVFEVYPN